MQADHMIFPSGLDGVDTIKPSPTIWGLVFGDGAQYPDNRLPDGWSAERDAMLLGPCPHSWLFPRVGGVVCKLGRTLTRNCHNLTRIFTLGSSRRSGYHSRGYSCWQTHPRRPFLWGPALLGPPHSFCW